MQMGYWNSVNQKKGRKEDTKIRKCDEANFEHGVTTFIFKKHLSGKETLAEVALVSILLEMFNSSQTYQTHWFQYIYIKEQYKYEKTSQNIQYNWGGHFWWWVNLNNDRLEALLPRNSSKCRPHVEKITAIYWSYYWFRRVQSSETTFFSAPPTTQNGSYLWKS